MWKTIVTAICVVSAILLTGCPDGGSSVFLVASVSGQGTVTLKPPGGTYAPGTVVAVTADPAEGWLFDHWAGDVAGQVSPMSIVLDQDWNVCAVFVKEPPRQYRIEVRIEGQGTVTFDPPGGVYAEGTLVKLTAVPADGWRFDQWKTSGEKEGGRNVIIPSGWIQVGAASSETKYVNMDGDKSFTAVFEDAVIGGEGTPAILFDDVPGLGSKDNLTGHVLHVDPAQYRVAVAIRTNNWYNKPTWDQRTLSIRADGTWSGDITTGYDDENASMIFAALIPSGYYPPKLNNAPVLPEEFLRHAVATYQVRRTAAGYTRVVMFSGLEWRVRTSDQPEGPPSDAYGLPDPGNIFSDDVENVWVDSDGCLHLRIAEVDGVWQCAEVVCAATFGYGKYRFVLDSDPGALDDNVVAGLFLWSDAAEYAHREIDVEFATWQVLGGPNAQFVVQPYSEPGHQHQFDFQSPGAFSTHAFTWETGRVSFSSERADGGSESWIYEGVDVPLHGDERPHINLWLFGGFDTPPTDGNPVELIIRSFEVE